ncbi:Alpha/Beta hydrolase protein [Sparassis latifolia]
MYPPREPYETGRLKVSEIHILSASAYEVSGNKEGSPVVFVHGGPGSGSDAKDRSFFNPAKYKIVLLDQRGAGMSTPSAVTEENTTWDLVKDIERIRELLNIDKWHVFGSSWGSSLSLVYAQAHPNRVKPYTSVNYVHGHSLELRFFYQDGTWHLFPDAWEDYLAPSPKAERHDMILVIMPGSTRHLRLAIHNGSLVVWSYHCCRTCAQFTTKGTLEGPS